MFQSHLVIRNLGVLGVSVAQTVTIDPVGAVTAVEGDNLTIICTDGASAGMQLALRENRVLFLDNAPPNEVNGMARTFQLPVDRTKDGNTYDCEQVVTGMVSPVMTLTVTCKWSGQYLTHYNLVCGFGRLAMINVRQGTVYSCGSLLCFLVPRNAAVQ